MAPQAVELPISPTVTAGTEDKLECKAVGAYPEANITWTLKGRSDFYLAQKVSYYAALVIVLIYVLL